MASDRGGCCHFFFCDQRAFLGWVKAAIRCSGWNWSADQPGDSSCPAHSAVAQPGIISPLHTGQYFKKGENMVRHFIIDTDTASDDAVALVMSMRYPGVKIEAITVVAGNVPVDQGVQNALYTVELCQQAIPVYRGMASPMNRPLETAQYVHGEDGMGDIGLPLSGRQPAGEQAFDVFIETIHRFAGEITLVTLGPLTNVATALQ
ncbi:MAG TPA: nucleoside hydrolase [Anaerolineales bacterium]|nr:nucleoside hydrolase [Anaerolineales bacterium]